MWLEDFVPNESGPSWPQSPEISEKIKESIKKAAAWIKKVEKDKKKAKKHDELMVHFLTQIIQNKKYDSLLTELFKTLNIWATSSFVLWVMSLVYLPISDTLRKLMGKELVAFSYTKTFDEQNFSEDLLDDALKNRINIWVEDINFILNYEHSTLQIQQLLGSFKEKHSGQILQFTTEVFIFFFHELHIKIPHATAKKYCDFILREVFFGLQKIPLEEI